MKGMSANERKDVLNSPEENMITVAHPELKQGSSGLLVCEGDTQQQVQSP